MMTNGCNGLWNAERKGETWVRYAFGTRAAVYSVDPNTVYTVGGSDNPRRMMAPAISTKRFRGHQA